MFQQDMQVLILVIKVMSCSHQMLSTNGLGFSPVCQKDHHNVSPVIIWIVRVIFRSARWLSQDLHKWLSGSSQDLHHIVIRVISCTCHHRSCQCHQHVSVMGWWQVLYHCSYFTLIVGLKALHTRSPSSFYDLYRIPRNLWLQQEHVGLLCKLWCSSRRFPKTYCCNSRLHLHIIRSFLQSVVIHQCRHKGCQCCHHGW